MTETDRQSIRDALEQRDWRTARLQMRRLLLGSPNPATAQFVLKSMAACEGGPNRIFLKLAVLRSFTLEPVIPLLRAAAALQGIELTVQVGDFNAYAQEVLDPCSQLYRFDPDAVVLAVQTQDLVPDFWHRFAGLSPRAIEEQVAAAQAALSNLIHVFRQRHRGNLIVHNLETPAMPATGVLDAQADIGQCEAIRAINRAIAQAARETPGVYVLDYDLLTARYGKMNWRDEQMWLSVRLPISAGCLGHLAHEYLRYLVPIAGRNSKALVLDLDNTLWGGVIGEEGLSGIQLGPEYPGAAFVGLQRAILDLYDRGVLLAICSKNNPEDAMEALEKHPHMLLRPQNFAAMRINWNDKIQNLREIAEELNIGIDTLAFLDDNPQERERVGSELPEVHVVDLPEDPMLFASALRECTAFERLTLSVEDRERPRYYAEQAQRKQLESQAHSLKEFYHSLQMEVEIAPVDARTLPRAAQLTQKTNQFNLTTRRYTEQQVAELLRAPDWRVYCLRSLDKFGDNGVVGVAITHRSGNAVEIDNFLLSCRVIGRTIETAFLAHLTQEAIQQGAAQLRGSFLPTRKNIPAKSFYASAGFTMVAEKPDGETLWEFDLRGGKITCPEWIHCTITGEYTHA
jgi:FkbH-like protein